MVAPHVERRGTEPSKTDRGTRSGTHLMACRFASLPESTAPVANDSDACFETGVR